MEKIVCPVEGCKRKFKAAHHLKNHQRLKHQPISSGAVFGSAPKKDPEADLARAREELEIEEPKADSLRQVGADFKEQLRQVTLSEAAARGMVRMPFNLWASLAKCKELGLEDEEAEELAAAFREVWNQYSPDWLAQHGALVFFGMAAASVGSAKLMIWQEFLAQKKKKEGQQHGATGSSTGSQAGASEAGR